jgi:8-oxo-dGTP pyrophosphatase MutT (NUDIX family)
MHAYLECQPPVSHPVSTCGRSPRSRNISPNGRLVLCANCGGHGHVFKTCNHPIISYGIILYRACADGHVRYLMVQRRSSLAMVEFVRGKYELRNRAYLLLLFTHMTDTERDSIRDSDFDNLWNAMWCRHTGGSQGKCHSKEYTHSKHKFDRLKMGYVLRTEDGDVIQFGMDCILRDTSSTLDDTEWGWPKGRRAFNESDCACAMREFHEESGLDPRYIRLRTDVKPLDETFSGTNSVRYKHVYYIAHLADDRVIGQPLFDERNMQQAKEIKDVRWFTLEEGLAHIRSLNTERRELFKRVHAIVTRL